MSSYIRYPNSGGVATYATFTDLPAIASNGTLALTLDTDVLYAYNTGSSSWVALGGATSVLSIGAIDSNGAAANGASISLNNLVMQSASATRPGLINNAAQTLSGIKTFNSAVIVTGGVDSAPAGTVNISTTNANITNIGRSGGTVNILGTTLYENVTNLQVADKLIGLNIGGGAATAFGSGVELEENAIITGYAKTSIDRNSWNFLAPNTAGIASITPGASGIVLDQSSHNPITLTAVGAVPNANGASLSSQALTLQPANTSFPGVLTASDWNTFNSKQAAGSYITALTGDATAAGPGSAALTLATVNGNVGSFGTASQSLAITANAKGLITAITAQSIQIAESQVTNLVSDLAGKQATGNYITALTGDATAAGPGSAAVTLATVNGNVGSFGTASSVSTITVNAKGLVTAASDTSIQIAESQVTNLVSDLAGKQATGNYITALTGDVVAAGPGSASSIIQAGVVSNSKLATMATATVKANITGGTASPTDVPFVSAATSNSGVFRDGSGNFAATTITANLTGLASNATTSVSFTGALAGEVTGNQGTTVLGTTAVTGKGLTGFVSGAGTVTSADSILSGIQKLDGNTNLKAPLASPTFTGTVTIPSGSALGTPTTLVGTNITGTASGLTAGTVTTNANLTGPITSSGNATAIASQTGTGTTFAMSAGPTFTGAVGAANITASGVIATTFVTDSSTSTPRTGFSSTNGSVRMTGNATITIDNIAAGVDGQRLAIVNQTSNAITLSFNNSSGGKAIIQSTGAPYVLGNNGAIDLIYDSSSGGGFWFILGK